MIPASLAIISIGLTAIGIAYDRSVSYRRLEESFLARAISLSRIVLPDLERALVAANSTEATRSLGRLVLEPNITLAFIADADGTIVQSTAPSLVGQLVTGTRAAAAAPLIGRALATREATGELTPDGARAWVASALAASRGDGAPRGTAVLFTETDLSGPKDALVREIVVRSAALGGAALLVCAAIWWYLHRTFTSDLDRLVASLNAVAAGQPGQPADAQPVGELARIDAVMRALLENLKREHADRRDSDEKFARIFERAPMMISVSEIATGRFIEVNDAALRLTGFAREEVIGRTSIDLGWFTAATRADMLAILERDGRVESFDVIVHRKNGDGLECVISAEVVTIGDAPRLLVLCQDLTEYKRAQRVVLDQARQFRQLLDRAPVAVGIAREGHVYYANQALLDMHGLASLEDALGAPMGAWVAPEARDAFIERARRRLLGQDAHGSYETVGIRPDGSRFPVLATASLVQLADGPAVIGFFQDVSEQRAREQRLRESEARFRQLFNQLADSAFILDSAMNIVDVNQKAADVLGYSREELLQMHVADLETTVGRAELAEMGASVAVRGEGTVTGVHRRKDGSLLPIEVHSVRYTDAEGRLLFYSLCRDVTERVDAERHLRESEARFRAVVETSHDGILFTDRDARITYRSPAYSRLNGFESEERVGRSGFETIHPDDLPKVREVWQQMLDEPGSMMAAEYRAQHKDGTWRWQDTTARNLLDNPHVRAVVITSRDVSERKRVEEERASLQMQLAQSQKIEAVGRLAGGVAHDFNNMLSVILGCAELALGELDEDAGIRNDLLEIQRAAERSSSLTRQLLAFARQQPVAPRVLDLNHAVEEMLAMLRRLIGENIALAWEPGAPLQPVLIDPTQIDQMLANLCVNARDAIKGIGSVTIKTSDAVLDEAFCATRPGARPGDYVRLSVHDTGAGMSDEVLTHIFEPFFTTKGVGKGTGLGLATVYGVVTQNHGFIDVESTPGAGSTFAIYLPAHRAAPSAGQSAPGSVAAPQQQGTILLVEDEQAVLHLTERVLRHLGYTVVAAHSPSQALALADEHDGRFDLLMTDVIMPEMNGRELARTLRAKWPAMRCLFTSGYTAEIIAEQGGPDEDVTLLRKPWTRDTLAAKLRDALGGQA